MTPELREKLAAAMHDAQVDRRFTERQTWDTAHKDVQALFLLYADALAPIIAEVEAAAWSASRDAATAEIVELRQSLLMAESWFRDYADQHNAKTPPDTVKAATNAERADYCHKAIDVAIAEGDATAIRAQKEPSA